MAKRDRDRGKAFERVVAAKFGFRRRSHGEHGGFDDCVLPEGGLAPISIECKTYAVLQLRDPWVEQAVRNSGSRPWIIAQRPRNSRRIYGTVDLDWLVELVQASKHLAELKVAAREFMEAPLVGVLQPAQSTPAEWHRLRHNLEWVLQHQTGGGTHGFDGGGDTVTGTDPGSTDPQTDRTVVAD